MKYYELIQRANDYARSGLIVEAIRILTVVQTDMEQVLEDVQKTYTPYRDELVQLVQHNIEAVSERMAELRKVYQN